MSKKQTAPPAVFDRALLAQRRARAVRDFHKYDFLFREVAERLRERRGEVLHDFTNALHIGPASDVLKGAAKSQRFANLRNAQQMDLDEENLGIEAATHDLITSNMTLQWVNDLPGALIQTRRALAPDGLFLAAIPGGETLNELRQSLLQAELDETGGAAQRISPMIDVKSLGMLLMRAGFALPVVDVDRIEVSYQDPLRLLSDLRGMGESNALAVGPMNKRPKPLTRGAIARMADIYRERFSNPSSDATGPENDTVRATFDIMFVTAWAPHPDQPKPLAPGSAKVSLASVLGDKNGDKSS